MGVVVDPESSFYSLFTTPLLFSYNIETSVPVDLVLRERVYVLLCFMLSLSLVRSLGLGWLLSIRVIA